MSDLHSWSTYYPDMMDSIEELLEYIESSDAHQFNEGRSLDAGYPMEEDEAKKILDYLESLENFSNEQPTATVDTETSLAEQTLDFDTNQNQESLENNINIESQNQKDDITKCFDHKYWLIHDSMSRKIRPPKICEFLQLLLCNSNYKSYASWIDKDNGLFKIYQTDKVADLWQKVKTRQHGRSMSVGNFERCIRYHYQSGLMIKTHRKRVYRFAKT